MNQDTFDRTMLERDGASVNESDLQDYKAEKEDIKYAVSIVPLTLIIVFVFWLVRISLRPSINKAMSNIETERESDNVLS
jgi:hypothetical protein